IVVDAENGQPIEGAVILVEWTKVKGLPGMTHTESYKVVEVVTDKEGKAVIEGVAAYFVSMPRVTVYKKGYVAWNNEYVFPDWKKRTDFKWKNNYVFKLEKFKPEYSYIKHTRFISSVILVGAFEKKVLMYKAMRWEELKASEERNVQQNK
ncbi:MAG: carboxypeptidase-like regulatory domain-containing protein, partial [Smithella sp.]